jgi:dihydrofolate reductase
VLVSACRDPAPDEFWLVVGSLVHGSRREGSQVRSVVVYELLSVDGVAEEPSNWVFEVDEEVFTHLRQVIDRQDDVLLGRGTYDYWAGHWPTSDMEPFAGFINRTPKHVFTSSPLTQPWSNSTAVHGPAEEHVAALRQGDGGDIGVHASITLARSLMRAGLVDELRLMVAPTIAGTGRRLFDEDADLRRLELLDVVRTPSGIVLLDYGVTPAT